VPPSSGLGRRCNRTSTWCILVSLVVIDGLSIEAVSLAKPSATAWSSSRREAIANPCTVGAAGDTANHCSVARWVRSDYRRDLTHRAAGDRDHAALDNRSWGRSG